jgi:hypothetical protein
LSRLFLGVVVFRHHVIIGIEMLSKWRDLRFVSIYLWQNKRIGENGFYIFTKDFFSKIKELQNYVKKRMDIWTMPWIRKKIKIGLYYVKIKKKCFLYAETYYMLRFVQIRNNLYENRLIFLLFPALLHNFGCCYIILMRHKQNQDKNEQFNITYDQC